MQGVRSISQSSLCSYKHSLGAELSSRVSSDVFTNQLQFNISAEFLFVLIVGTINSLKTNNFVIMKIHYWHVIFLISKIFKNPHLNQLFQIKKYTQMFKNNLLFSQLYVTFKQKVSSTRKGRDWVWLYVQWWSFFPWGFQNNNVIETSLIDNFKCLPCFSGK